MRYILYVLLLCLVILFGNSCTNYKHIAYFEDVPDTAKPFFTKTVPFKNPVIETGDLLTITIQTIDNDVTQLLNSNLSNVNGGTTTTPETTNTAIPSQATTQIPNAYLVDKDGDVDVPFIGVIHLTGLTTAEARSAVKAQVDKQFNNAIVNVRFANFKVTVLGEVTHPSSFIIPDEKVNIFDALGLAGDLTVFGIRNNVLLLRDTLEGKKIIRLNLNSKNIVSSPWFYLQPNDVIYVEPSKYKVASVDAVRNRNITIIASVISVIIIAVARIK